MEISNDTRPTIYFVEGKPPTHKTFRRLLGCVAAKRQYRKSDGTWSYTRLRRLAKDGVRKHLSGKTTLAFCPIGFAGSQAVAMFICLDIDEAFRARLPLVREILERRKLAEAAFAVGGSDEGRGKVVVCFEHPVPQTVAVALVKAIYEECLAHPIWGHEFAASSTYPGNGQGGVVRIGGRNQSRTAAGHLDEILDIRGKPSDLSDVRPYSHPESLSSPYSITVIEHGENKGNGLRKASADQISALSLVSSPYSGNGNTIFADMSLLARDAIRLHGNVANGRTFFESQCDVLSGLIPSEKRKTLAQARAHGSRERAWSNAVGFLTNGVGQGYGVDRLGDWKRLDQEAFKKFQHFEHPRKPAWRIYNAIATYVIEKRLDPHCFTMAYSQLAELANYSDPSDARRAADSAEVAGLLFRTDRGADHKVSRGLTTIFSLVGQGETPQIAYDLGLEAELYKKRQAERAKLGLPALHLSIRGNRLIKPPPKKPIEDAPDTEVAPAETQLAA